MIKYIIEAWLSPSRKEIYEKSYISLDNKLNFCEDALELYFDHFDHCSNDGIFSLFDETEQDGLWKIVAEVDLVYTKDYWGEVDLDFYSKEIYKSKCNNFSDLIEIWSAINPERKYRYRPKPKKNYKLFVK